MHIQYPSLQIFFVNFYEDLCRNKHKRSKSVKCQWKSYACMEIKWNDLSVIYMLSICAIFQRLIANAGENRMKLQAAGSVERATMCIYVYMYIYIYVYIHIHIHVYSYLCLCQNCLRQLCACAIYLSSAKVRARNIFTRMHTHTCIHGVYICMKV